MGESDTKTKEYMSDSEMFADVFNYFLHDGAQVIKASELRELDSTINVLPFRKGDKRSTAFQKFRDIFKLYSAKTDDTATYILYGIENQSNTHYAMPVRNMFYDAAGYVKQVEEIAKKHRADKGKKKVEGGEYLSGFYKDDMLFPVITLVIFWSPEKWDGARSIHEMIEIKDRKLLKYVSDYKINLISPWKMREADFDKFSTSLAEALHLIKYSNNKEKLYKAVRSRESYLHLDRRTVEVVNSVAKTDIVIPEGEQEVNVCKAIDDMKKDAKKAGRIEGRKEGRKEGADAAFIASIKNLMDSLKLNAEQAMDALKIPAKDQKRYAKML